MQQNSRLFHEPLPEFHLPQLHQHYLDDALDEMELLGFTLCNPFELVDDDMVRAGANHGDDNMVREDTNHGEVREDVNHGEGFALCNPFARVDDDMVREDTNDGGEDGDGSRGGGSDAAEVCDATMLNSSTPPGHKKYIPAAGMPQHLGKTVTMLGYLITWKPVHTVKRELMYFGTFIDAAGDWLDTVHFPDSVKAYPLQGKGFYRMTGQVVEEFGVYNLEVHRLEKLGIKSRAATRAGALLERQKGWQQGLIRRP